MTLSDLEWPSKISTDTKHRAACLVQPVCDSWASCNNRKRGNYKVSMFAAGILFSPEEVGEHLVNVLKDGEHIANSPFKLLVSEGNASKVKAWGKGLEEGTTNEVNEFTIDTKDAGQDRLDFVFFLAL